MAMLIILLAVVLSLGGIVWKIDHNAYVRGEKTCQEKQAKADAKIAEQGAALKLEAENKIIDMTASFEAGEQKQKSRQSISQQKGLQNAQTDKALRDPKCNLDANSLRDLNSARSGLRSSADSAKAP